jgi:hypothetical protein
MLANLMIEKKADVLSIDSFIRTHQVNENDNAPVEQVIECFEDVAERANCGVHLWHHTRKGKGNAGDITVEASRGASAFIDACRSVRIFETMSAEQAKQLGVTEDHRQYFRAFSGKRNFAPHLEDSNWFFIMGVELDNGAFPGGGDNIGVVTTWSPPEVNTTPEIIEEIKQTLASGEWREDVRASMWAGKAIAQVLNRDPVNLQNLHSSSRMLDTIFQIAGKSWATEACLSGLIRALDELLYPQVHLCSGGHDKKLTIKQIRDLLDHHAQNGENKK